MSLSKAIEILDRYNKWRRDMSYCKVEMNSPVEIGKAIDVVVDYYKEQKELMNTEENNKGKGSV